MKFYVLCGILTLKGINHRAMKVWLPYVLSVIFSVNIYPDSQLFFNFKGNKMQLKLISSTWGTYILLSGVKNAKDLFFKHFTKLLSFGLTLTSSFFANIPVDPVVLVLQSFQMIPENEYVHNTKWTHV